MELDDGLEMGCDEADVNVVGGPALGVKPWGLGFELVVLKGEMMGGLNGSEGDGCKNASKRSNVVLGRPVVPLGGMGSAQSAAPWASSDSGPWSWAMLSRRRSLSAVVDGPGCPPPSVLNSGGGPSLPGDIDFAVLARGLPGF